MEFKIGDKLEVKLEKNSTFIYVNGVKFRQCKKLLLNIPKDNIGYSLVNSVDELVYNDDNALFNDYESSFFKDSISISPKEEFWAHCSNLQAWFDNNYDTRLLHRNLAFPLLKQLAEIGDPTAKEVFKEEIAKRIASKHVPTIKYLIVENFTKFLSCEELEVAMEKFRQLDLINCNLKNIPKYFFRIENLKELYLDSNSIVEFPKELAKLKKLEVLFASKNQILLFPNIITHLKNIRILNLAHNYLKSIPNTINRLKKIEEINFSHNNLSSLPLSFKDFKNLKKLNLSLNNYSEFPEEIYHISSLEYLNMSNNKIKDIKSVGNLDNLKYLNLSQNQLDCLPDTFEELKLLKNLSLGGNKINSPIKTLMNLISLEFLDISGNSLNFFSDSLKNLPKLKEVTIDKAQLEQLNEEFKMIVKKKKISIRILEINHPLRQWESNNKFDPKNPYITTIYDDGTWSCTCPRYRFRNFYDISVCDHILNFKEYSKQ